MTTMTLAHGGTAGLLLELAFVAVPILLFVALALVASRREKARQAQARTGADAARHDEARTGADAARHDEARP